MRVVDYAARHQLVRGTCRAKGCNRRVELSAKELCGRGQGLLTMDQIKRAWQCQRLEGCALEWHDEPPELPLTLTPFVGKANVRVQLRCRGNGCTFYRRWTVEEIVSGLRARKQGDERVEIAKLGALMTSACPVCKKVNWAATIIWADTSTMGWRQMGERYLDSMGAR